MNDESQYHPKQNHSERGEDADSASLARNDAEAARDAELSTPFAPEDAAADAYGGARQSMASSHFPPARSNVEAAAAFGFGATDPAESEEVRRQATADPALAAEIEEFRAMHRALHFAAAPVAPPASLAARLRAATQPEGTEPASQRAYRAAPAPIFSVPQPTLARVPTASLPSASAARARDGASSTVPPRVNPLTGKPLVHATRALPASAGSQFATVPAASAQMASQMLVAQAPRTGAFAANTRLAWGGALLALLLVLGTNYFWYAQMQSTLANQAQTAVLQTQFEQAQSDLANARQDLQESRDALESVQATLAQSQTTLATAQADLAAAQSALLGSQAQLTSAQTQVSEQLDLQATLISLLAQTQMQTVALSASNPVTGTAATPATTASARIVWEPVNNAGMLVTMEMPQLPDDQVYQLWYLRGGVPYSAGMFTVDASGKGMLELNSMEIADYDVAAITPEPMGGSPAPTGPILIVGEL